MSGNFCVTVKVGALMTPGLFFEPAIERKKRNPNPIFSMPFVLHPSGYCTWYSEKSDYNLTPGVKCPHCQRIAGHRSDCPFWREPSSRSTRTKIFDTASVLWYRSHTMNFFTFTLPPWQGWKTYQISAECCVTGDVAVSRKFSKLLENVSINIKRQGALWKKWNPGAFSYLWVAEAQMERQEKFGGVGDIHFHLITNAYIPIKWLTATWERHLQVKSGGSVHVDHIPNNVNSLPNYLAKYFGKGTQRRILSRRYSCTRDLSGIAPIKLQSLPQHATLLKHRTYDTQEGFEINYYYYDTGEVLSNYIDHMQLEGSTRNVTRMDKNFEQAAILQRSLKRDSRTKHLTE